MPEYRSFLVACLVALLVWIQPASASTITFDATDSGWYRSTDGFHNPVNENFFAGADPDASAEFRNFFVFELACQPVPGNILSVTLRTENVPLADTAASPQGGEIYEVFGFSGTIGDLTGGTNSFGDLGSGTSFGTSPFVNADVAQLMDVLFNASGRAAIGAVWVDCSP